MTPLTGGCIGLNILSSSRFTAWHATSDSNMISFLLFKIFIFWFIWLCQGLVVARGIFIASCRIFPCVARRLSSCSMKASLARGMWDPSSLSRVRTRVSCISWRTLTTEPPRKALQSDFKVRLFQILCVFSLTKVCLVSASDLKDRTWKVAYCTAKNISCFLSVSDTLTLPVPQPPPPPSPQPSSVRSD